MEMTIQRVNMLEINVQTYALKIDTFNNAILINNVDLFDSSFGF